MLSAIAITALLTTALGGQRPLVVDTPGCDKGKHFVNSPAYGVSSSKWGHLPRGGWRGAVQGLNGKIYGIPTNTTSVSPTRPRVAPPPIARARPSGGPPPTAGFLLFC